MRALPARTQTRMLDLLPDPAILVVALDGLLVTAVIAWIRLR